jgi:hypothetical protein
MPQRIIVDQIIAGGLAGIGLGTILAMTILTVYGREIPQALVALGAGVVGALGGGLRPAEERRRAEDGS